MKQDDRTQEAGQRLMITAVAEVLEAKARLKTKRENEIKDKR